MSCHKSLTDKELRLDNSGLIIPISPRDNRRAFPKSITEPGLASYMMHKPFAHKNLRFCCLESTHVAPGQHGCGRSGWKAPRVGAANRSAPGIRV